MGEAPREHLEEAFTHAARGVDPREYDEHNLTGGGSGRDLTRLIPGMQTTDPSRMSPQEVASLASYVRQRDPEAFGRAAAQVSQDQPSLVTRLLGNKAVMAAAAGLAMKYMNDRMRR